MVYFVFYLFAGEIVWQFEQTGIYRNLGPTQIAVTDEGSVYLADPDQCQVLLISPMGKLVLRFGGQGSGPGEFNHLTQIFFDSGRLYAYDDQLDRISVFAASGKFERTFRVPKRRVRLLKIPNGWLLGDWRSLAGPDDHGTLFRADESMVSLQEVFRLPGPFYHGGLRVNRRAPDKAMFTPFTAQPQMRLSLDRKLVFLADATQCRIHIIATKDGRLVKTLTHDVDPVPMDRDWVDAELAATKRDFGGKVEAKVIANVPDHFPAIRRFWVLPRRDLALELWKGEPNRSQRILGLSPDGGILEDLSGPESLKSLRQISGNRGYHLLWHPDREEIALVVKTLEN